MGEPIIAIKLEGYEHMHELLDPKIVDRAAQQALNKAVTSGRAEAARQIYAKWNIKKADINRAVKGVKASGGNLTASIQAKGRPLSLSYFGAKQFKPHSITSRTVTKLRKRKTGKSGVYAKIMRGGDITHKPHAFLATVAAGKTGTHIGVFERVGKKRMPIVERKLITVASMFSQANAWEPTVKKVSEVWSSEFPRLIEVLFAK